MNDNTTTQEDMIRARNEWVALYKRLCVGYFAFDDVRNYDSEDGRFFGKLADKVAEVLDEFYPDEYTEEEQEMSEQPQCTTRGYHLLDFRHDENESHCVWCGRYYSELQEDK